MSKALRKLIVSASALRTKPHPRWTKMRYLLLPFEPYGLRKHFAGHAGQRPSGQRVLHRGCHHAKVGADLPARDLQLQGTLNRAQCPNLGPRHQGRGTAGRAHASRAADTMNEV